MLLSRFRLLLERLEKTGARSRAKLKMAIRFKGYSKSGISRARELCLVNSSGAKTFLAERTRNFRPEKYFYNLHSSKTTACDNARNQKNRLEAHLLITTHKNIKVVGRHRSHQNSPESAQTCLPDTHASYQSLLKGSLEICGKFLK